MRKVAFLLIVAFTLAAAAQDNAKKPPTTLRGVLLEQLRTTHSDEDWFVPANIAVAGLTADQAKWTPLRRPTGKSPVVLGYAGAGAVQGRETAGVWRQQ
jgi:hypothetical protein